jgi:DNA-binding helix-hairpin-helix protein with protein kinase domain
MSTALERLAEREVRMMEMWGKIAEQREEREERMAAKQEEREERMAKLTERKLLKDELKEIEEQEKAGSLDPPAAKEKRQLQRRLEELSRALFPPDDNDIKA